MLFAGQSWKICNFLRFAI